MNHYIAALLVFVFLSPSLVFSKSEKIGDAFYPVNRHQKWIISLGDQLLNHKSFKREFETKYNEVSKTESEFEVSGVFKDRILNHLGISEDQTFYYIIFGEGTVHQIRVQEIETLYVKINPAGGFGSGTLGLTIPSHNIEHKDTLSLGIAKLSESNPFSGIDMSDPRWEARSESQSLEELKKTIERLRVESAKRKFSDTFEVADIESKTASLGEIRIEYAKASLDHHNGYVAKQFYIKIMQGSKVLKTIEGDGEYSNFPAKIWFGKLDKELPALMLSPSGMGSCGTLITLPKKGTPKEHPLSCGSWGC